MISFKIWLLNEEENQTEGMDEVLNLIKEKHPTVSNTLLEKVKHFVEGSGVKKIQVVSNMRAAGAALHDKILIVRYVFDLSIERTLYVILHETAHQYQLKKYGYVELMKFLHKEITPDEAVQILRKIETVADEFAIRKLINLQLSGEKINARLISPAYKGVSDSMLKSTILAFRTALKDVDEKDPIVSAEILANLIGVIE